MTHCIYDVVNYFIAIILQPIFIGESKFSDAVLITWAIVVPVIFAVIVLAITILFCKSNKLGCLLVYSYDMHNIL